MSNYYDNEDAGDSRAYNAAEYSAEAHTRRIIRMSLNLLRNEDSWAENGCTGTYAGGPWEDVLSDLRMDGFAIFDDEAEDIVAEVRADLDWRRKLVLI